MNQKTPEGYTHRHRHLRDSCTRSRQATHKRKSHIEEKRSQKYQNDDYISVVTFQMLLYRLRQRLNFAAQIAD